MDRAAQILSRLNSQTPYRAIAEEFGVTRQRIHQIAKKVGLDKERRRKRVEERDSWRQLQQSERDEFTSKKIRIQEAVEDVRNGMHPAKAAIRHKVRYQSLTNAMSNAGVRSPNAPRLRDYSDSQLAAATELVANSQLDSDEIAWATGVGYLTVLTLRKRLLGHKHNLTFG